MPICLWNFGVWIKLKDKLGLDGEGCHTLFLPKHFNMSVYNVLAISKHIPISSNNHVFVVQCTVNVSNFCFKQIYQTEELSIY